MIHELFLLKYIFLFKKPLEIQWWLEKLGILYFFKLFPDVCFILYLSKIELYVKESN